ncbi:MAG: WecB/TagA/CpsF family glycosyltransferase [Chloroflexi bacterium]|nr:WecB/TagA/CpsF family glycosyltransferase [Chloroflexota bacterium]
MARRSIEILGVRVDDITIAETLACCEQFIAEGGHHHLVTVNPEFVITAQDNDEFRRTINASDCALPDGAGLVWAARLLGGRIRERVTGADTVPLLAQLASQRGFSLYLLGAAPGVADQAAQRLQAAYPGLRIAGTYSGSPRVEEQDEITARIRATAPDMLFVAYGAPAQDLWISRNRAALPVPVCMGVGGTLDFIAGIAPRAPKWMRRIGAEWLFRLVRQPWRWRRMARLPVYMVRVMQQRLSARG